MTKKMKSKISCHTLRKWKYKIRVNEILVEQLVDNQKQCWSNAQYLCRDQLKVVSIPSALNGKGLHVFQEIRFDIEPCHRHKKGKTPTIAKLNNRNDSLQTSRDIEPITHELS